MRCAPTAWTSLLLKVIEVENLMRCQKGPACWLMINSYRRFGGTWLTQVRMTLKVDRLSHIHLKQRLYNLYLVVLAAIGDKTLDQLDLRSDSA